MLDSGPNPRRFGAVLAGCSVAALVAGGCSLLDGASARISEAQQQEPSRAVVAVMAPLDGPDRAAGAGVLAAVEQAVTGADAPPGWVLDVTAIDSYSGELSGAELTEHIVGLAEEAAADPEVVAVVGGTTEAEVLVAAPLLSEVSLPLLSPSDEDPAHWRGADPTNAQRPWRGYGVTTVLSHPQESALADYLAVTGGVSRVAVVHDGSTDARESAMAAEDAIRLRDGRVVLTAIVATRKDVRRAMASAESDGAEAVVVLGREDLVTTARELAPDVPLLAVARLLGVQVRDLAAGMEGVLLARGGPDPDAGRARLQRAIGSAAGVGPYGVAAYDAAALALEGLQRCLPRAAPGEVAAPVTAPPRDRCADDIVFAQADGLTRTVVLDDYGARVGMLAEVGLVADGRWQPLER